jgi:outer membrane protein assembly factor BamB
MAVLAPAVLFVAGCARAPMNGPGSDAGPDGAADHPGTDLPAEAAPEPPLASPWPMVGHDPQHTFCSRFVGPQAPIERWVAQPPGISVSAAIIAADGSLFVSGSDDRLYRIDAAGAVQAAFERHPDSKAYSPPSSTLGLGLDGPAATGAPILYVSPGYGPFHARDPRDGHILWSFTSGRTFSDGRDSSQFTPPVIGPDGRVYVAMERRFYAFDPRGTPLWHFDLTDTNDEAYAPTLGRDGIVLVGAFRWGLEALSPAGQPLWSHKPTGGIYGIGGSPQVGPSGTIYFVRDQGQLDALGAGGGVAWSAPTDDPAVLGAIAPDETLYLLGRGSIIGRAPDRTIAWKFGVGAPPLSLPIADAQGTFYIGTTGQLEAVGRDGRIKWSLDTGMDLLSPAAIGADGTLYVVRYRQSDKFSVLEAIGGGGRCEGHAPDCEDGDPCTVDACDDASGCVHRPRCDDGNPCTADSCRSDGTCESRPVADGTPCTLSCAPQAACQAGVCAGAGDRCALHRPCWPATEPDGRRSPRNLCHGPASTPTIAWQLPGLFAMAVDEAGRVYGRTTDPTGVVRAIDPAGATSWEVPLDVQSVRIGPSGTVYARVGKKLHALDSTGKTLWTFEAESPLGSDPAVGPDGVLYLGASDHFLYAVNPDGKLRWRVGGSGSGSPAVVAADGTIYVGGPTLRALSPAGQTLWSVPGPFDGRMAIGDDGALYMSTWKSALTAIDRDGSTRWRSTMGGTFELGPRGQPVLWDEHRLTALSSTGEMAWSFAADAKATFRPPSLGDDGLIYVAANSYESQNLFVPRFLGRSLYALRSDGGLAWKIETPATPGDGTTFSSTLVGPGGRLYLNTSKGLWAFDP